MLLKEEWAWELLKVLTGVTEIAERCILQF